MFARHLPQWLSRDLTLLLAAQALMALTFGYLPIIVPIYLASLGYGAVELGFLVTASSLTLAALATLSGVLSHHLGRRYVIIGLSIISTVACLIFSSSRVLLILIPSGALGSMLPSGGGGSAAGIGAYYPAAQALLADCVEDRHRTSAFATLALVVVIAIALGSLMAKIPALLNHITGAELTAGYRLLFVLTAVLNLIVATLVAPIREASHATGDQGVGPEEKSVSSLSAPRLAFMVGVSRESWPLVWRFMLTNFTNGLAVGPLGPFVTYWFYKQFALSGSQLGTLFFVIDISVILPFLVAGALAFRFGAVRTIVASRTLSAVFLGVMPFAPTSSLAGAAFLARMVLNAFSVPVRQSYLMGVVHPSERASATGIANLPLQTGASLSALASGYLMQNVALAMPLELSTLLQLGSTLLYHVFFNSKPPVEEISRQRITTG